MKIPRLPLSLACALLCLPGILSPSLALAAADEAPNLIAVKVSGTGAKTVVFIPGLATSGAIWDDSVTKLEKDATCYVITLAGFGGNPPPADKHEHLLADVRDEILAYLRERKVEHPLIVGHSLGGVLALDLAVKAPELPGRLLIVDSLPFLAAMMVPGVSTEADAKQLAAGFGASISAATPERFAGQQKQFIGAMITSPEKAAVVAAMTSKSDPPTTGQAMQELLQRDLRSELPAIKCPVLVLGSLAMAVESGASHDAAENGYRAQYANLPQAKFQFFDHARHFIMVDDPDAFQKALAAELAQ